MWAGRMSAVKKKGVPANQGRPYKAKKVKKLLELFGHYRELQLGFGK